MAKHRGEYQGPWDFPGFSHRGEYDWEKSRKLAEYYGERLGCPICLEVRKYMPWDKRPPYAETPRRTHHCYWNFQDPDSGIDVCYQHYRVLSGLFWYTCMKDLHGGCCAGRYM